MTMRWPSDQALKTLFKRFRFIEKVAEAIQVPLPVLRMYVSATPERKLQCFESARHGSLAVGRMNDVDPHFQPSYEEREELVKRAYAQGSNMTVLDWWLKDPPDYIRMIRRDPCVYCGAAVIFRNELGERRTIDHIMPRALGGPNHNSNYAGACLKCNAEKADTPLLTYLLRKAIESDEDARNDA